MKYQGPGHSFQARRVARHEDFYDLPQYAPDWGTELDEDLVLSDTFHQRTSVHGQREVIPWERKVALYAAHQFQCLYCGKVGALVLDHVVPVSAGGSGNDSNLVPACRPCNTSKRAQPVGDWMAKAGISREDVLRRWRESNREGGLEWLV